jgi:hypothetical protein
MVMGQYGFMERSNVNILLALRLLFSCLFPYTFFFACCEEGEGGAGVGGSYCLVARPNSLTTRPFA